MVETTFAACAACQSEGEIELPAPGATGPLTCINCDRLVSMISVTPWRWRIDSDVTRMEARRQAKLIGTRKQSHHQSDETISRDGREAELAACLILCPGYRADWFTGEGPNRGCDLPSTWTGLPKPVEVKQTRYCDDRRGYLLIRPPRNTPGRMLTGYIDDSLYLLMYGQNGLYTALGWADRPLLLRFGCLNPIPVRPGQRECWGIHWKQLHCIDSLVDLLHGGNACPSKTT